MKRPTYLQQAAAPPSRRGVPLLSPPRLVFRPGGAAAEFVVREARPSAMPASTRGVPIQTIKEPVPSAAEVVRRLHQAAQVAALSSATPGLASPIPAVRRIPAPLAVPQ